jgi:hypothetical protein
MGRPNIMRLTRRDVARIKALAESVTEGVTPAAIADLDAPWRVAAMTAELAGRSNGEAFGTWAGLTLVAWWRPGPGLSGAAHREGEAAAVAALRASKKAP